MSEITAFAGLVFLTFFFLLIFSNMASYNAQIQCPDASAIAANQTDPVSWVVANTGLFFSPCSGLDWWVYLLIFVPLAIAIIVHVLPFVG